MAMNLEPNLRLLLVRKSKSLPSTLQDGSLTDNSMDSDTVILCEVLELDVKAMANLSPYRRAKVLAEAKRNVKKWPILNHVQRVEVNCALVELQYAKAWEKSVTHLDRITFDDRSDGAVFERSGIEADGKYGPVFTMGWDGTLDIRYEWVSTEDELLFGPTPLVGYRFHQDRALAKSMSHFELGEKKSNGAKMRIMPRITVSRYPLRLDDYNVSSKDLDDQSLHLENTKIMTGKVYRPEDITRPDQRRSQRFPPGFQNVVYPYFLPNNQVKFFPALTGHRYELKECKMILNELDINAFIAKVIKEVQHIKKGKDGFMLAEWEMTLEFGEKGKPSCPFIESHAFDEWEAIARNQQKRPKYREFSPRSKGPSEDLDDLCDNWI